MKIYQLQCNHCGKPFRSSSPTAMYHSTTCREAAKRARKLHREQTNNPFHTLANPTILQLTELCDKIARDPTITATLLGNLPLNWQPPEFLYLTQITPFAHELTFQPPAPPEPEDLIAKLRTWKLTDEQTSPTPHQHDP